MKFLVMWRIEIALMSRGVVDAVLKMADYAKPLEESHKVLSRYHIPGAHGASGYTRSTPTKSWICCSRDRRSITSHGTKCSNCGDDSSETPGFELTAMGAETDSARANQRARVRIRVDGIVQGVGFRPFVHSLASRIALSGFIRNDSRGVVIEVEGAHDRLGAFVQQIAVGGAAACGHRAYRRA